MPNEKLPSVRSNVSDLSITIEKKTGDVGPLLAADGRRGELKDSNGNPLQLEDTFYEVTVSFTDPSLLKEPIAVVRAASLASGSGQLATNGSDGAIIMIVGAACRMTGVALDHGSFENQEAKGLRLTAQYETEEGPRQLEINLPDTMYEGFRHGKSVANQKKLKSRAPRFKL